MITRIELPQQAEPPSQARFVGWLKQEGDPVVAGEALFEVEIDKATIEIPSPGSGYLRQAVRQPGDVLEAGELVGYLSASREEPLPQEGSPELTLARTRRA